MLGPVNEEGTAKMTRTVLAAELRRRGWSKSKLAREAGVNQTIVIDVTNGRRVPSPESETLRRIAVALDWPADAAHELLGEAE